MLLSFISVYPLYASFCILPDKSYSLFTLLHFKEWKLTQALSIQQMIKFKDRQEV